MNLLWIQIVSPCSVTVFVVWALQPDVILGLNAGNILQHSITTSSFSTVNSCYVTAAWHLFKAQRELRETWCICFSFPTIRSEFQLKSHTHTCKRTLGWLRQCALVIPDWEGYSRQIQLAMLVHSTKPFVLQTHVSAPDTNTHARPQMPTCAWKFSLSTDF